MKAKQIGNLRAYVWFAQQSKDLTYPAAAWQIAQLLGTGFSYEGGVEANTWLTEHMARHNTVRILNGTFSGDRFARGAFGTHLWRKNPQWGVIRKQPGEDEGEAVVASGGVIKVTARVVASGGSLATLALHAVCNEKSDAADAGCPWLLMPSFRVLGGSDLADEMAVIEFELPANSAAFIVPSVHSGEEGAYTLVVSANEPIDIFELGDEVKDPWAFSEDFNIEWSNIRPFAKTMGGGRASDEPPLLPWYRNPQFRVRLKSPRSEAAGEERPVLLSVLVPFDGIATCGAAVHLIRNTPHKLKDDLAEWQKSVVAAEDYGQRVGENPRLHTVAATSGRRRRRKGRGEYESTAEVGAICELLYADDDEPEPVFVVPSLVSEKSQGQYGLRIFATEEVIVERV